MAELRHDDTTVSAIARRLGVAWNTVMNAVTAAATDLLAAGDRLTGVKAIGVDEHIWRPSKTASADKAVTVMVDLTRDEHGHGHARLLDVVTGRSGNAYADWLTGPGAGVAATVEHAALAPLRGYTHAIDDELPDAVPVLDAFHLVKLAGTALEEVRRRIQQDTWAAAGTQVTALPDPPDPGDRRGTPH